MVYDGLSGMCWTSVTQRTMGREHSPKWFSRPASSSTSTSPRGELHLRRRSQVRPGANLLRSVRARRRDVREHPAADRVVRRGAARVFCERQRVPCGHQARRECDDAGGCAWESWVDTQLLQQQLGLAGPNLIPLLKQRIPTSRRLIGFCLILRTLAILYVLSTTGIPAT
ncbi:hypothetical protein DFH07DRAFT_396128 [Mycena maculata]|uniref:Uncharacterized protein n=1 Tax=Mycena maculata TaxID=230809 RepID=A0AAD7JHP3_9AGAR|nr:hypothetical protein DFH07DRAFT_396128 [Mycena maculata]